MQTSAPVLFQRMRPEGVVSPSDPPLIGIFSTATQVQEGATAVLNIQRLSGARGVEVTIDYRWSSQLGDADFAANPAGTIVLPAGQTSVDVAIQTAVRSGVQNTRQIGCTLNSLDNGFIDPGHAFAAMDLIDYDDAGTKWWKQLAYRSGRPWAAGVSYNGFPDQNYELMVSWIDGFGASRFGGKAKPRASTWQRMAGGPQGNPAVTDTNGQPYWIDQTDGDREFTRLVNMPALANKTWVCWVHELMPTALNQDEDDADFSGSRTAAFDYINSGAADQWFKDLGARIMLRLSERGIDPRWFMGRPYHELQQTNYYRVYADTKQQFMSAYNRAIDKVREGAGFHLRYMFAPGQEKTYDGQSFGALSTWWPSSCDFISPSWHPGPATNNRSTYLANMINGTAKWYGMEADVWNFAAQKNIPIGFCEWSPHYEATQGCPIADDCYQWFHDEFLVPHKDDIVVDLLFDQTALQKGIYANPNHPNGPAHWDAGVDMFCAKWKGTGPSWPNYVPSGGGGGGGGFSSVVKVATPYWTTVSAANRIVPSSWNEEAENNFSPGAGKVVDLRGRVARNHIAGQQGRVTPINLHAAAGAGVFGFRCTGMVTPRNKYPITGPTSPLPWQAMKFGSHGAFNTGSLSDDGSFDDKHVKISGVISGTVYIEDFASYGAMDGIDTGDSGIHNAAYKVVMRRFYAREVWDDFIQNDQLGEVECEDFLVDSCHFFTSVRPGSAFNSTKNLTYRNGLIRLGRGRYFGDWGGGGTASWNQNALFTKPWLSPTDIGTPVLTSGKDGYGHNQLIKDSSSFQGQVNMTDCVVFMEGIPLGGPGVPTFPPGTYTRVTLLYAGPTASIQIPTGMTMFTDKAQCDDIWQSERTSWLNAHGNIDGTGNDFWFLHS